MPKMLPSSSSQFTRYGQINHLKKFWLLQTQLEKQEQNSTAATLSLGTVVNTNVKESKPLATSTSLVTNADHHLINGSSIAGHGSCRVDMATCSGSSSRAGAFPYNCSNDQTGSLRYHLSSHVGLSHASSQSSNIRDSPTLSLAVNCESVATPKDFLNQTCSPSSLLPTSDLHLLHTPHLRPPLMQTFIPNQVQNVLQARDEEYELSACSNGRGEKGSLLSMDNPSTSPRNSTSSITLSSKDQFAPSSSVCNPPTIISSSCHEAGVLPSSARSSHGLVTPFRTCTVCGTSKTPLWRGGPNGPKSLCNACGIRMKKTKRLQAAMEAAGGDAERAINRGATSAPAADAAYKRLLATTTKVAAAPNLKRKLSMEATENQSDATLMMEKKKKKGTGLMIRSSSGLPPPPCAGVGESFRRPCYRFFGDSSANLEGGVVVESSKNLSNLLAHDVEEAAVLLMALSCGLVLS